MKHRILSFLLACTFLFLLLPTPPAQAAETADELISAFPIGKENERAEPMRAPEDYLQDSTLAEPMNYTHSQYNCYAFAMGLTSGFPRPGDISGRTYSNTQSVFTMADNTVADLIMSGYSCVRRTTSYPSSIASHETVICLRTAPGQDFHFMKKVGSAWLHKPGATAILKYNYTPSNSRNWTNERIDDRGYHAGDITYTSDIAYIIFGNTHGTLLDGAWTGNHYHSGNKHYYEYWRDCQTCNLHAATKWVDTPCNGVCVLPYALPFEPMDVETLSLN